MAAGDRKAEVRTGEEDGYFTRSKRSERGAGRGPEPKVRRLQGIQRERGGIPKAGSKRPAGWMPARGIRGTTSEKSLMSSAGTCRQSARVCLEILNEPAERLLVRRRRGEKEDEAVLSGSLFRSSSGGLLRDTARDRTLTRTHNAAQEAEVDFATHRAPRSRPDSGTCREPVIGFNPAGPRQTRLLRPSTGPRILDPSAHAARTSDGAKPAQTSDALCTPPRNDCEQASVLLLPCPASLHCMPRPSDGRRDELSIFSLFAAATVLRTVAKSVGRARRVASASRTRPSEG